MKSLSAKQGQKVSSYDYAEFVSKMWGAFCDRFPKASASKEEQEGLILMQSAPELLEACKEAKALLEKKMYTNINTYHFLEAVIAKAEGTAQ